MGEPLVYIILVNYNGYEDTLECVESLKKMTYSNYRIVIVDNDSNDANRLKWNEGLNESSHIIYANRNGGFSYGNNIGMAYALKNCADYVLLLNNDTVVRADMLTQLVNTGESRPDSGIVTGNIRYYSDPDEYWYINGNYNRRYGVTHPVNALQNVMEERKVSFISGCLMLIKSECIKNVGMLDESFFMYSEDTEYCLRCMENGYTLWWNPKAQILHKAGASIGNGNYLQGYYMVRNNLYVVKKYGYKKIFGYAIRMYISMMDCFRNRLEFKSVIDGYSDFFKGIAGSK